ncbi:MAG: saccharopine dehydrogenase [Marivirga sp.]|nr:saccharopine dehydrogenase [Marivirga sp.]
MDKILVLGAGRSSTSLITYLLNEAGDNNWEVTVADYDKRLAHDKVGNKKEGKAIGFDINDDASSKDAIADADIVISLMPAHFHSRVARHCLELKKHLLNASYVSDEMKALHDEAKAKGLLFLNECGLDPGIDHMSAMQVIDRIKNRGGKLVSFESFTGGLIAPETDPENPWRYKFTWNPRNVVMAGQGTAKFLQQGKYKYIPYQQLFQRLTNVTVQPFGEYEGYANRDSLKYLDTYGLHGIQTMLRGTLRNKGYCSTWNVLVQLGCCDDTYVMEGVDRLTHGNFIDSFLDFHATLSVEEKILKRFQLSIAGEEMKRLRWSGLFSNEEIGLTEGTPAQILEHILSKKWTLAAGDKDFIVMWHRFVYELNGTLHEIQAHLTATGNDERETAMAKTVGLPLGIAAKLLLQGKINSRGVVIPVLREFYEPILISLGALGIQLVEKEL